MNQSRTMSLVEAVANVVIGFVIAIATQVLVFPFFGMHAPLSDHLLIGAIFTVVSIVRSYLLRRGFERLRERSPRRGEAKTSGAFHRQP